MTAGDRRPSGVAQDQPFRRFRKGEFDVDKMLTSQRENAAEGQKGVLIALGVIVALALVLAVTGSQGGAVFMVTIAFALLVIWGVLALVRRFT